MKLPIRCPKCKEPLLNMEVFDFMLKDTWKKMCHLKLDHKISYTYNVKTDDVILFNLRISERLEVWWDFKQNTISILDPTEKYNKLLLKYSSIPFFEPNPYKYNALVSKIKTYIIFS